MSASSSPSNWLGGGNLLQAPATAQQHGARLGTRREDEEARGVGERVEQPAAVCLDERAREPEAPLGERQALDLELELALPGALDPAERRRRLGHAAQNDAALVSELERDERGGDAGLGRDRQLDDERLAGRELAALVAVRVEQPHGGHARLAATPLA